MKTLAVIEDCSILLDVDSTGQEIVSYVAKAAIDGDGAGSSHGDPDFQNDTSLHNHGAALNADVDQYIVVPPAIIEGARGIVLGCKALVKWNGRAAEAVVGDIGPHVKLGEISIATAKALGIPASPLSGGIDAHEVEYILWPGIPAPGYSLQPHTAG